MLQAVTLTLVKQKTSEKTENMRRKKNQWPPPAKRLQFWGLSNCCLSGAPVLNVLNTKVSETD